MPLTGVIIENLPKLVTTVAGAGLVALFTWLAKRGSWTKEHKLARLCEEQGDKLCQSALWTQAIEKYKAAIEIWEKEVNQTKLLALYQKVGKAYLRTGDTLGALEAFNHCEALWETIKNAAKMHEVYYALAEVYLGRQDYEKAAAYIDKTIAILKSQQSPRLPVALALAARIARERCRPEEAEARYVEATSVLESIGDTLGLASVYYELGELKTASGALRTAISYYSKSAVSFTDLGSARASEILDKVARLKALDPSIG